MDKCWFVFRQTHYPAPEYTHENMAFGKAVGPIRLGHFIASPREVDNVINSDEIIPFPANMRIWLTTAVNFRFTKVAEKGIETSIKGSVPVAATAGLNVDGDAAMVFKQIMGNTWGIDRLDTQIVQPTMAYLEQCRKSRQVAAWVDKNKVLGAWKVYMISGLMIARGAKNEKKETGGTKQHGGGGVEIPGIVTAKVKAKHANKEEVETMGRYENSFVWAMRLTEVSKSLFGSDLSQKVVRKGAVFAPRSGDVAINAVLAEEGLHEDDVRAFEVFKGDEKQFLITMDGY